MLVVGFFLTKLKVTNQFVATRIGRFTQNETQPTFQCNLTVYTVKMKNSTAYGKSLEASLKMLQQLGMRPQFAPADPHGWVSDLVFVTYSSRNHFEESVDAVATVQTLFPGHVILFYDVGLSVEQIIEVHG